MNARLNSNGNCVCLVVFDLVASAQGRSISFSWSSNFVTVDFITEYQSSFDIFDAHKMAGWSEFNNLAWEVIEMI